MVYYDMLTNEIGVNSWTERDTDTIAEWIM